VRRDQQQALRELHDDYAQPLWRFAMRLVHDRAQAQVRHDPVAAGSQQGPDRAGPGPAVARGRARSSQPRAS